MGSEPGGDERFEALYRSHAASVFRRALRLLGSDADAQDIVSDVFTSLYERPEQHAGRSALTTFLYAMTTNACLTRIRNHQTRARLIAERSESVHTPAALLSPDDAVALRSMLSRVPELLGQVAVYYYVDELTHEEIAQILGCSRRHVGDLLVRLTRWAKEEAV